MSPYLLEALYCKSSGWIFTICPPICEVNRPINSVVSCVAPASYAAAGAISGDRSASDSIAALHGRPAVGCRRSGCDRIAAMSEKDDVAIECELLGRRGVTEFNYRYDDAVAARIFVGVALHGGRRERVAGRRDDRNAVEGAGVEGGAGMPGAASTRHTTLVLSCSPKSTASSAAHSPVKAIAGERITISARLLPTGSRCTFPPHTVDAPSKSLADRNSAKRK